MSTIPDSRYLFGGGGGGGGAGCGVSYLQLVQCDCQG